MAIASSEAIMIVGVIPINSPKRPPSMNPNPYVCMTVKNNPTTLPLWSVSEMVWSRIIITVNQIRWKKPPNANRITDNKIDLDSAKIINNNE